MRVAWLVDDSPVRGGAELTMDEFKAAAPKGVEIVDHPAGADSCPVVDAAVIGNCVTYGQQPFIPGTPVVKYWNDLAPHGDLTLRRWLLDNATNVYTSPLHRRAFPHTDNGRWKIVPPPVDLERFRAARNGEARGSACHVGNFMYGGKGSFLLNEWSEAKQTRLNVYGTGPFSPDESEWLTRRGPLEYDEVPTVLARHEWHVHLPTKVEPFGRSVVEAWAAGCQTVTNGNVGARYFIEECPERLETAAQDFWRVVEAAA